MRLGTVVGLTALQKEMERDMLMDKEKKTADSEESAPGEGEKENT